MSGGFTTGITQEGPWKAQEDYLKRGFARAESAYKGGPAPYFPGPTLAGFDPAQEAAQAATLGYAQGPRPAAQQELAERQMGRTYQTATDLMGGRVDTGAGTPYGDMASAYKDQVISQLTDPTSGVLPGIRSGLVNYQPGGSTRGNMLQQQAIADAVTKGMSMPLAQMYGQAYQQAQGQRLPAAQVGLAGIQQYPSLMAAPMAMYGAMGDVGAQRRAMAQESINQAMQKYEYGATAPQVALQNYMAGISGEYGGQQQARPSALQSMGQLGSFLSGLG
jgi:hypothetical protein